MQVPMATAKERYRLIVAKRAIWIYTLGADHGSQTTYEKIAGTVQMASLRPHSMEIIPYTWDMDYSRVARIEGKRK